jgi:hypothetical protein
MIVLVANSGRLEQATVELSKPLTLESLDSLRIKLKSTMLFQSSKQKQIYQYHGDHQR